MQKKLHEQKYHLVNMNNNNKIDTLRNDDEQKNLHKPIMYTLKCNQLVHRTNKPTENKNF